ncbi:hypothetical protein FPRO06_07052 [Fusarium proliferatum]|nr:hypothetical protein FPRO06_07052 [Fusarium proliferatum]
MSQPTQRQAWRRTDDHTKGTPKVKLVTEDLPLPLHPTFVLIKVHAVALNYRDANIANGGNPWPVTPNGIPGNDAAGTGGVSTFALKLARASGLRVILTSSSDEKLEQIKKQFGKPETQTVNYKTHPEWHKEVLRLTNGVGVDLIVENGGSSSLVQSMECTRRGGIVSQVGYLGGPKSEHLKEFVSTIIDRRLNVRGINAGSKDDQDELMAAISATQMTFEDILDSTWSFDKADEAIAYVWQGKQVGKVIVKLDD